MPAREDRISMNCAKRNTSIDINLSSCFCYQWAPPMQIGTGGYEDYRQWRLDEQYSPYPSFSI